MHVFISTVQNFPSNFRDLKSGKIAIGSIIPVNWDLHSFYPKA